MTLVVFRGLMSKNGTLYHPTVVRVGVHIHHSVQSVSLDALIDQKLSHSGMTVRTSDTSSSASEMKSITGKQRF